MTNTIPAPADAATMTVTVRDRDAEPPWGSGRHTVATRQINISANCPRCGDKRGQPQGANRRKTPPGARSARAVVMTREPARGRRRVGAWCSACGTAYGAKTSHHNTRAPSATALDPRKAENATMGA